MYCALALDIIIFKIQMNQDMNYSEGLGCARGTELQERSQVFFHL